MTTLIIGVPWNKKDAAGNYVGKTGQKHSFEIFCKNEKAIGYELYTNEYNKVNSDISAGLPVKVVLLRNDRNHLKRAEAQLTELNKTTPTKKYHRYNISFKNHKEVTYTYPPNQKLKYNGVRVI